MKKLIPILLSLAVLAGCNKQQLSASSATPAPKKQQQAANVLTGPVAETMNAAGYTYIRIGDQWAAVRETNVKVGDTVTISTQMVAENFESKTLNRKFDKIIFGELAGSGAAAAQPQTPNAMGTPAEHMKPAIDTGSIKVEKAAGGKTVADVWALKGVLKDQPVVVRGKVVKFLPGIMGKNWMHLRDGSGSRANGDDDITVTTNEMVKVGDVVTVSGTVRTNKDFGAGYEYPVIIEDAKLKN